jgi:hypothetical protein
MSSIVEDNSCPLLFRYSKGKGERLRDTKAPKNDNFARYRECEIDWPIPGDRFFLHRLIDSLFKDSDN